MKPANTCSLGSPKHRRPGLGALAASLVAVAACKAPPPANANAPPPANANAPGANNSPAAGAAAAPSTAAPAGAPSAAAASIVRDIAVTAQGFEPARVEVPAGQPAVLRFTRKVLNTCADAVDVQGDPVRHMLPLDRTVEVRIQAPASGEVAFACPMNMYRGAAVAK